MVSVDYLKFSRAHSWLDASLFTSKGLAISLALLAGALLKIVRGKLQISKRKNA